MIQTTIGHIQFNVHPQNLPWYRELLAFAGWPTLVDTPGFLGMGTTVEGSLWFFGRAKAVENDFDGPGMNHLALQVQNQDEVDQMTVYLTERQIPPLFGTPCHRPEFSLDAQHTYYQVMFASPDHILFEVVYTGLLKG